MFSVRRSLAWMGLSQGAMVALQFGSSVLLARLLSPYEMGIYAISLSFVGLLAIIRALGLPAYLVRSADLDEDMLASVFTVNALVSLLLAGSIAGLSAAGGWLLGDVGVQRSLLWLALTPLIAAFEFLPAALIERSGGFRTIAAISLCRALVGNGMALVLAYAGYSYMSLVYGQIMAAVLSAVGFNLVGRQHARLRLSLANGRNVARYAAQMVGISGVTIFSSRMSELVLGRLQGLSVLGLYSRASGLSNALEESVHVLIARVVFVEMANQKRDGRSLRAPYMRALQMMTVLLWPMFLGLAVLARPVILLLYGEVWLAAAEPLSLLCVASAITVSITLTWEVFNVCQETGRQARIEFIRAGVGLVLFAGGSLVGMTTAAAARVVEACFSVALYRPHLDRLTESTLRDLMPIYVQSAILTVLAIVPSIAVMTLHDWSASVPLPIVAASVLSGVAAWALGLVVLRHPLFDEAVRLMPARWSRR